MLCSKAAVAPDVLIGKHKLAIQKSKWKKATGTWYGNPHGDANDGKGKHSNFFKIIFICNITVVLWKFKIYGRLIEKNGIYVLLCNYRRCMRIWQPSETETFPIKSISRECRSVQRRRLCSLLSGILN